MATLLHHTLSKHFHFRMLVITLRLCGNVFVYFFNMTFMVSKPTMFTLKQLLLECFYYNTNNRLVRWLGGAFTKQTERWRTLASVNQSRTLMALG